MKENRVPQLIIVGVDHFRAAALNSPSLLVQLISNSAFQIPICVLMMACSLLHIAVVACPDYGSFIHHTFEVRGFMSSKENFWKASPQFLVFVLLDLKTLLIFSRCVSLHVCRLLRRRLCSCPAPRCCSPCRARCRPAALCPSTTRSNCCSSSSSNSSSRRK